MVRIKGANSDYKFDVNTGQIEGPKPADNPVFDQPVYLKIFICPYDMPSRVEKPLDEQEGNWCEGTDNQCPHAGDSPGHAVVSLHQDNGIRLETNNGNQLVVDQQNGIRLRPDAKTPLTSLDVRSNHIVLQRHKTRIEIAENGNIALSVPPQNQVTVNGNVTTNNNLVVDKNLTVGNHLTVNGHVTVNGNVTVTGRLDLSKATVNLPQTLIDQIVLKVKSQA
ncbi:hypothetical protein Lepto7375DRAFT_1399 [Leptolyngbya sp. PCC 7375]|nr:hypothetical protein Lepto7375DRAFT_1399 [Leptolyngbya sp. PCC 7375]